MQTRNHTHSHNRLHIAHVPAQQKTATGLRNWPLPDDKYHINIDNAATMIIEQRPDIAESIRYRGQYASGTTWWSNPKQTIIVTVDAFGVHSDFGKQKERIV